MKKVILIFLTLLTASGQAIKANIGLKGAVKNVIFEVELDSSIVADPILIVYENAFYQYGSLLDDHQTFQPASKIGKRYRFLIPEQSHPKYFSVIARKLPLDLHFVNMFVFEPGDNIRMKIKPAIRVGDFDVVFSGKNSAKYTCRQKLKFLQSKQTGLNILKQFKANMSIYIYQLLYADMIFRLLNFEVKSRINQMTLSVRKRDNVEIERLRAEFLNNDITMDLDGISNVVLFNSAEYLQYRYMDSKVRCYNVADLYNGRIFFDQIKKVNDSGLRDRLFVLYFIHNWKDLRENYDKILQEAIVNTSDKTCLKKLEAYLHNRNGQSAFNLALQDKDGKIVQLSDFKGKVVFIDFYFTGCTFCRLFYKYVLADVELKYAKRPDIVFVSVSIDRHKEMWLQTLQDGQYTSRNSVNLYTNGESDNHPLIKHYNILSYPSLMLVDREGRILKFSSKEMRTKEGLEEALKAAISQ
jgi:thiol-disulfide isomerase/thioredoxin